MLMLVTLIGIAIVATAQNQQPSADQRIKQLEDKVAVLQDHLLRLETSLPAFGSAISPAGLGDPLLSLRAFQNSVTILHQQRSELLKQYTPEHPKVRALDLRIEFLRSQLVDVAEQINAR